VYRGQVQSATVTYFNIFDFLEAQPNEAESFLRDIYTDEYWGWIVAGKLTTNEPCLVKEFGLNQVDIALKSISQDPYHGIYLIVVRDVDVPTADPLIKHPAKLDPNGIYLLVGGLGGLGRFMAKVLADLGANRLAFFSRSGKDKGKGKALDLFQSLEHVGVEYLDLKVDIRDAASLGKALDKLGKEWPGFRIKGVVQAAAVLKVCD
jgi:hypothetical protein